MRIFISYAHVDMPFCKQLVNMLEAHEVWFDQNLRGGEDWWQKILEKLDWCESLLFLLSPESFDSQYCEKEAKLALKMGKTVIPIIIQQRTPVPQYLKHDLHPILWTEEMSNKIRSRRRSRWQRRTRNTLKNLNVKCWRWQPSLM
jgi:hypothetical protein